MQYSAQYYENQEKNEAIYVHAVIRLLIHACVLGSATLFELLIQLSTIQISKILSWTDRHITIGQSHSECIACFYLCGKNQVVPTMNHFKQCIPVNREVKSIHTHLPDLHSPY